MLKHVRRLLPVALITLLLGGWTHPGWSAASAQAEATQVEPAAEEQERPAAEPPEPDEAPPEAAEEVPPEAPPVTPLASEIPRRAQEVETLVRQIRDQLQPVAEVTEIAASLPALVESIEQLKAGPELEKLDQLSLRRLGDLRQEWTRLESQLTGYDEVLAARATALETERETLQQQRAGWETARRSAREEGLPPELVQRVDAGLAAIRETEGALREHLDGLLVLQARVSEQQTSVAELLDRLRAAREIVSRQVFTINRRPLWRAMTSPEADTDIVRHLVESWSNDTGATLAFLEEHNQRFLIHVSLFLVLTVLLILLERRSRGWLSRDESLKASAHILRRPASSALFLTLLLTRWLYPQPPTVIYDLNQILFLIPLLRLLPGLMERRLHAPLYALAWLYLLGKVADLVLPETLLARLLLLLITVLALAGAIWMVRPGSGFLTWSRNRWWRAAMTLMRLGIVLLAVSLLANLVGGIVLAEILIRGSLSSAYAALVLSAGTLVVGGLAGVIFQTHRMQWFPSIRKSGDLIQRRLMGFLRLVALGAWLWFTLDCFRLWDPAIAVITAALARQWTVGTLAVSLGDIAAFVVVIWLATQISRFVRFLLDEDVFPRLDLPRGTPASISILVNYVILAVGFVVALAAAGIEWTRFAIIAGGLGVGIGFGLQNVVNNFVSGLILIFERPVQIGDTVEVGSLIGVVRRIGIRASTIRTFDGAEVIVPNGDLISKEVVNWTLSDRTRRIDVRVGVAYGTDPNKVLDLLLKVANEQPDLLKYPEPGAFFLGFGDSSLDFLLRFWTADFENWWRIQSQVTVAVNDAIVEAGIEIPFPQRDLHLRSVDSGAARAITGNGETTQPRS
jgi:small-conductance mechanosensitive channel